MEVKGKATEQSDGAAAVKKSTSRRVIHLAIFWFVVWPFLSVLLGAYFTINAPTTQVVPFGIAFTGVLVGVLYLIPEFLVTATILFLFSWLVFAVFPPAETQANRRYFFEPAIAFIGLTLGISLEYPAILSNSIFTPIQSLPLLGGWVVMAGFLLVLAALRNGIHRRNVLTVLVPVAAFVAFGWGLAEFPVAGRFEGVNRGSTVILGIDSMGEKTDIDHLRTFARENGGAFYEKAVTPGLLTNSVWTAMMQHRPIHETGVTLIFQNPDWNRSPFQMVREAKQHGYQTWSYFTGQNTIYLGSIAGFDVDRSGPMGWLDNATVGAKNGSIFVPFMVSRLPQLPFSKIRRNQAGTYAYDLRTVVHNILSGHYGDRPVFAVAHLGYLHDDAYPRMAELTPHERSVLMQARIAAIKDAGSDWQIPPVEGDPIDLRTWKYQNVQRVITDEVSSSGFLDAENKNRLVILSDHGMRGGLHNDNFADEKYYHVPLITFGVPARNVNAPISLLDVPGLVGLHDPTRPGPSYPVVEYTNWQSSDEYTREIRSAKWTADGRISLSSSVGNKYLGLLRTYDPYKMDSNPANDDRKVDEAPEEPTVPVSAGGGPNSGL